MLIGRYGHLYYPFKPPGVWYENACVYCGNRSQELDHVPPLDWVYALGEGYFRSRGLMMVKVPSCKECNVLLGKEKLFSLRERTVYLLGKYLKRYEAFMTNPLWTDDEIEELEGVLKGEIQRFAAYQRVFDHRIGILEENVSVR